MSTPLSNAFVGELSIVAAALGADFTAQLNLPRSFIHTGGGTVSFTDENGDARTVHAAPERSYHYTVRAVTGATGAGYLQFFPGDVGAPVQ